MFNLPPAGVNAFDPKKQRPQQPKPIVSDNSDSLPKTQEQNQQKNSIFDR